MSKKYFLIELSYEAPNNTSADAVLHNERWSHMFEQLKAYL